MVKILKKKKKVDSTLADCCLLLGLLGISPVTGQGAPRKATLRQRWQEADWGVVLGKGGRGGKTP